MSKSTTAKNTGKRGRPTVSTSARQARLEARAARVASGLMYKATGDVS